MLAENLKIDEKQQQNWKPSPFLVLEVPVEEGDAHMEAAPDQPDGVGRTVSLLSDSERLFAKRKDRAKRFGVPLVCATCLCTGRVCVC